MLSKDKEDYNFWNFLHNLVPNYNEKLNGMS